MRIIILSSLGFSLCLVGVTSGCGSPPPARNPEPTESTGAAAPPAAPQKPVAQNAGSCPATALIDDFEDGDNQGVSADGRGGYWYTYKDPSSTVSPEGTFAPVTGGADDSQFSGRMSGTVGSQQYPYVGMGVSFTDPKQAYDVSCCQGIRFRGKMSGEGISHVRFKVGDWQTDPDGGSCKDCYNDFGADLTFTPEWEEYTLKFSELTQEPYWGEPKPAIDTSAVYQLQWQVKESGGSFDIQVDNVELIGCGEPQ